MCTWLFLAAYIAPAGTDPLRPALVTTLQGSPVVLEASRSVADQPFAEVTVRNISGEVITSLTFAATLGRAVGAPAEGIVRKAITVAVSLPARSTTEVAIPSLGDVATLAGQAGTVELALVEATSANGTTWRAILGSSWIGRPDVTVPVRCADGARVYEPGEASTTDGRVCADDGRMVTVAREQR